MDTDNSESTFIAHPHGSMDNQSKKYASSSDFV